MALGVMAGLWPLRPRSLHAGFWAGSRVMGVNQNISGLERDGRTLAIALKVLTRRSLRWGARYEAEKASAVRSRSVSGLGRDGPGLAIAFEVLTRRLLRWRARYGA